jgi:ABC-type dipeptide/oligopeptide/nickel transport system ATPase subunit
MSDRSDETGPASAAPGSESDAAHGETAPESARHESPQPRAAGGPSAPEDSNPDDTIPLPADAVTVRQTEETTSRPETTSPPAESATARETTAMAAGDPPDRGAATRLQPAVPASEPAPTADRTRRTADPLEHTAVFDRPNGTPFLTARGLTAHGRQGPVFTDINLTAGLGQLITLCGDGGEGRSSLLLALTGRFPFNSGALEVDGQTKPGLIRRRFTIAQAGPPIRFDPYATVATCIKETVTVSKGAATRANINAWLDRLAVGVDTGDTFGFLPRIDQVRFAIACAAAARTPAIAVDDVDTGLDTCGSERVFDTLRTVADAGQLVLAVCTRSDPPADTVVDLRAQPAPTAGARHGRDRNGVRR